METIGAIANMQYSILKYWNSILHVSLGLLCTRDEYFFGGKGVVSAGEKHISRRAAGRRREKSVKSLISSFVVPIRA